MRRCRLTEERIIGILKEHEAGAAVSDLCRRHGVGDASIDKWKAEFGGMDISEVRRQRALEDEDARLKRMLTDAVLDTAAPKNTAPKEVVMPTEKRNAVSRLVAAPGMSFGQACCATGFCRMTIRYETTRPDDRMACASG